MRHPGSIYGIRGIHLLKQIHTSQSVYGVLLLSPPAVPCLLPPGPRVHMSVSTGGQSIRAVGVARSFKDAYGIRCQI